jgi:hypothetical protein
VDAVENFTGAATDDLFKATAADFQALDSIDGGLGTDTLRVVDTAAFAGFAGATITGIENVSISAGSVGAIQSYGTAAGTNTAAGAQLSTVTVTAASTGQKYDVTIGGVVYTSAAAAATTIAGAADAIRLVITNVLGDAVTLGATDTTAGTFTITSNYAGAALPTIAVGTSTATPTATGTSSIVVTTANVDATGPSAVKQVLSIALADGGTPGATGLDAGDLITVSVGGVAFTRPSSGDTAATLAADVATVLNAALGAGVAVAAGGVVTVSAPTAGVSLPAINVNVAGASLVTDTHSLVAGNQAANAAASGAVSAVGVAAPTGTTAYTVVAGGDANVTGVSTAAVDVTGANVRASGGASVKVAASGNVYVSGSTGAVTVTETASDATGGFYVAAGTTTGTGLSAAWGTTTALKAGTLVTGGSTVTVTGTGGKVSTTTVGLASSADTSATQIGSAANVGVSSANNSTGKETILNAGLAPTGDVTISSRTTFTRVDTTNKVNLSSVIYGDGDTKVYMNGGATASVTGANTVTITDLGTTALKPDAASTAVVGTSKLTSATVNGLNGTNAAATINSDALTSLTVVDARGATSLGVTVNNNTVGGHALNLTVGNSGTSALALTVTDSTATTVNIASSASSFQALYNTAINTGSASFVTLATAAATTIKMTNAHAVSLGDLTGAGYAKVATLDASGATGAVNATIGTTSLQGLALTGGAGGDTVTVKSGADLSVNATSGAATTVSLGGGNDTLLNGGTAAVTMVGVRIDAGSGTDTVAASFINAGNAAQFVNFEVLGLDRATGTTTDANLLSGVTGLALLSNSSAGTAGTVTYTNVKASQGLTVVGSAGVLATGVTALSFEAAVSAGTTDNYTIGFAGAGVASALLTPTVVEAGIVSLAGIETVNVASGSAAGITNNTATLVAGSATSLVVTGSQLASLTLGTTTASTFGTAASATNGLGVSSIDASANTGGIKLSFAAGFESAIGALAIKGSAASDTITLAAFDAAVVTVDAGAGNDSITTAAQAVTLTLGAGTDTASVAASVVGALAGAAATLAEATGRLVTIKDAAIGDTIDFETATTAGTAAALGAATSVASATSVLDVLNALANSTSKVAWAVFGGSTYVLYDAVNTSTTAGVEANDVIVKFDGTFDFTTALYGATAGALTIV